MTATKMTPTKLAAAWEAARFARNNPARCRPNGNGTYTIAPLMSASIGMRAYTATKKSLLTDLANWGVKVG